MCHRFTGYLGMNISNPLVQMVWVIKKFPFGVYINLVFIRATETEHLGHGMVRSMVN